LRLAVELPVGQLGVEGESEVAFLVIEITEPVESEEETTLAFRSVSELEFSCSCPGHI